MEICFPTHSLVGYAFAVELRKIKFVFILFPLNNRLHQKRIFFVEKCPASRLFGESTAVLQQRICVTKGLSHQVTVVLLDQKKRKKILLTFLDRGDF